MNTNLRKLSILMSRLVIYLAVFFYSLTMVFGTETDAQRKSLKEISFEVEKGTYSLGELFERIESYGQFKMAYLTEDNWGDRMVKVESDQWMLQDFLEHLSVEWGISFKRVNETISVNLIKESKRNKSGLVTDQMTITGKITDESGEALPGASVLEKGTSNGTITDVNGSFSLITAEDATLTISFVGFKSKEVTLNGRSSINVSLSTDVSSLDEVVVVGYGSVRKSDLTGSVSSVDSESLQRSTISSLDQGLSGRAAGVQVTQQSGQPGGATSIRIRGGNSINSSNEPLYVIDGFPYYNDNDASQAGVIGGAPSLNALATLNPGDIESIEILKDASATAIYGSRGANGVILITTKRGKAGEGKIEFDTYHGFQNVVKTIPVLNATQFAEFRNDAFVDARGANGNGLPTYTAAEIAAMGEGTNWQEEIFRTAPIHNYQLTFSGGNENVKYAVTGSYFDQEGIVIGSDLKRYTLRANMDATLNSKVKIGNNFTASHILSNFARTGGGVNGTVGVQSPGAGNIIQDALFYNPVIPVRYPNGEYTSDNNTDTQGSGGGNQANTPNGNPVAFANLATQESYTTRLLDNIYAEYSILKDLKLKVSLGADVFINKQNSYLPSTIIQGANAPNGSASIGNLLSYSWLNENTLNYKTQLGNGNELDILVGYSVQEYHSERSILRGRDFSSDATGVHNIGSANIIDPPFSSFNKWSLLSSLLRINYNHQSKYLITLTARRDGSSKFGENNKYGFFPSAAIAYRLSEESFIKSTNFFDDLKLRVSAGITGNQEIPGYQSLSVLGVNRYPFDNSTPSIGFSPVRIGNPDIKWETTRQVDIGVDMQIFEGRLGLTTDLYYKKTDDLLLQVRLPISSGYGTSFQNIGAVENKGLELSLNGIILDGVVKWTSNFNIAFNRNKVLDFGEETERYIGTDYNLFKGQAVSLIKVGEPLGNFVGFINDGIIKNADELAAAPESGNDYIGSRRFVDLNNDGIIDNDDRTVLGNALPDYTGGLQNTFSFKNFELDVFFQYSVGNEIYNMTQLELEFLNGRQNNSTTVLDRFVPEVNEDTDVARAGNPPYVYFRQSHSRWVENGSFLRMRNISLSYNIPVEKMGLGWIQNARIYVNGQNLLTVTGYRGYDPEVNINPQSNTLLGFDYASYPPAKIFMMGVKIGF